MALLLDLQHVPAHACDHGLEAMFKAIGDEPPGTDIWEPHQSPFLRRLIELFTQRGLLRLDHVRTELNAWLAGERSHPAAEMPPRPRGSMSRWSPEEMALARLYLESLPPGSWTIDDYGMLVDWIVQRYMPPDDLRTEGEWLAQRAVLMGRVQAALPNATAAQADAILAASGTATPPAARRESLTPQQAAIIDYGRQHVGDLVQSIGEDTRRRIRGVVLRHAEGAMLNDRAVTAETLQTQLQDVFATLNRDWRRVAVTEAGNLAGHGFIASVTPGAKVKRLEHYRSACSFCRKIDGAVLTVVSPDKPDKDWDIEVWAGKDNVGRSASPRKRVGSDLVDRDPHELYTIPAGTVHPHCRGTWVEQPGAAREGDDPEFAAWLNDLLEPKK